MKTNRKTALASGLNQKHKSAFGANSFDVPNNTYNLRQNQCKNAKCRSEDLKYAVAGYCQKCLNKIEFITREHPAMLSRAQSNLTGIK